MINFDGRKYTQYTAYNGKWKNGPTDFVVFAGNTYEKMMERNKSSEQYIRNSKIYNTVLEHEGSEWGKKLWASDQFGIFLKEYSHGEEHLTIEINEKISLCGIKYTYITKNGIAQSIPLLQIAYTKELDVFEDISYHYYPQLGICTSYAIFFGSQDRVGMMSIDSSKKILLSMQCDYLQNMFIEARTNIKGYPLVSDNVVEMIRTVEPINKKMFSAMKNGIYILANDKIQFIEGDAA